MNVAHSQAGGEEDVDWRTVGVFWGVLDPPARGPRARYGIEDIALAGVRLADRAGLDGLTMGSVAAELGLTTTALYRYVSSKDLLIELMADVAVGAPPPLVRSRSWKRNVRDWVAALVEVYLAHPWLTDVRPAGSPRCPNGLAWYEAILAALDRSAITDPNGVILHLNVMVRGYVSLAGSVQPSAPPPDWFAAEVSGRFPRLAEATAQRRRGVIDEFWRAVDATLAALAASAGRAG